MAEVRVNMEQVRRDGFPPVCAACGAPATAYRRRWFNWTPGRNIPFALFGYWRYSRVTLDVPFCAADQSYFTRRWAPLLVIGLLAVGAAVATYITTDVTRGAAQAQALRKVLVPSVVAVLVGLGVVGKVVKQSSIRVVDVYRDQFMLAGVSDRFAAAMEEPPTVFAVND
jgi:hypothetical protein